MRLAPGLQGFIEGVTESVTAQSYTPALDAMNATDSAPAPTGQFGRLLLYLIHHTILMALPCHIIVSHELWPITHE